MGVDSAQPCLSWHVPESAQGGQRAHQVCVAKSGQALLDAPDLWDSGKVVSDQSQFIAYRGKPLAAAQGVFWRVRLWDAADRATEWSHIASWTMGLLAEEDWRPALWITAKQACLDPNDSANPDGVAGRKAQPIGIDCARFKEADLLRQHVPAASIQLRKAFAVKPNLARAILFSTGLAHYEATIDGRPIADRLLSPGWTNYRKTVQYDTTDVTSHLQSAGDHRIDLLLGNGMYNVYYARDRYVKFVNTFGAQKAIALLWLEYGDGTIEKVATDTSWQACTSPMTYSNVYGGEDYDQRLESQLQWQPSIPASPPGGRIQGASASGPQIQPIETLTPITVTQHSPVTMIFDLGQNASVMPSIVASGPAGSSVRIIPSELLGRDGVVDRASCVQDKGGPAYWKYTFDGRSAERLFPKFFYQGARYLQVEFEPASPGGKLPVIDELRGIVVHAAAEPAGAFKCSNALFNRIYSLVRWAQRSNMMHVMTDCPQREKLGWLEQLHLNGPSLRYNFRLDRFYRKVIGDMSDAQEASGLVPNIAPEFFSAEAKLGLGAFRCSIEWGSSFILAAWQQYLFHADTDVLLRHYDAMVRYFDFLTGMAKDDLIGKGLGDWYDLGPKPPWGSQLTPPAFTGSAIYMEDARTLAKIARMQGRQADAARFESLAQRTRSAINAQFHDEKTSLYTRGFPFPQGSQCATAMSLALHIAPEASRPALIAALVADIRANHNGLTAGDVGYRYVLRALADAGRSDVIFDMNTNPNRPGYAMQLARGATSLTEKWDASVGSFGSQNHFMLGQINEWFFHDLAGIQPDPEQPGFKHILFRPQPCGDVTSVDASYAGPYGPITIAWQNSPKGFTATITVPANSTAEAFIPGTNRSVKLEAGTHEIRGDGA